MRTKAVFLSNLDRISLHDVSLSHFYLPKLVHSFLDWSPATWPAEVRRYPCYQSFEGVPSVIGSEDCLYMDIHLPTGLLSSMTTSVL